MKWWKCQNTEVKIDWKIERMFCAEITFFHSLIHACVIIVISISQIQITKALRLAIHLNQSLPDGRLPDAEDTTHHNVHVFIWCENKPILLSHQNDFSNENARWFTLIFQHLHSWLTFHAHKFNRHWRHQHRSNEIITFSLLNECNRTRWWCVYIETFEENVLLFLLDRTAWPSFASCQNIKVTTQTKWMECFDGALVLLFLFWRGCLLPLHISHFNIVSKWKHISFKLKQWRC